jgi:ubiquinone/menaquinone biosynthesis C-methylase UbiE
VKYDRFIGKNAGIAKQKAEKEAAENIEFDVEGACKLSFPNHSFDTIIASNVFHLLFVPEAALKSQQIGIDAPLSPI